MRLLLDSVSFDDVFPTLLGVNGFLVLPPEFKHYRELLALPFHHRDPFDRLLVAQAKVEGLTILTCDSNIPAYGVPVLW